MATTQCVFENGVSELTAAQYRVRFVDVSGVPLNAEAILGIAITLVDVFTGEIVNSRDAQDALNANDGTLDTEGVFTLALRAEDAVILEPLPGGARVQHRRLTIRVRYQRTIDVEDELHHDVTWPVIDLINAPLSDEGSP